MKKKYAVWMLAIVAVLVLSAAIYFDWARGGKQPVAFDPLNATYAIDGQPVVLVNGKASVPAAPGAASMVTTSAFGEPVMGDLNGDGTQDAALMLVQDSGGSGTFYYAAAALHVTTGTQGTNAVFLGDRIAPQNIEIQNGEIIANYADRKPGEPMTDQPSVGVSKYLMLQGNTLVEASGSAR